MNKRQEYKLMHEMKLESYVEMAGMSIIRSHNGTRIVDICYDHSSAQNKAYRKRLQLPKECRLDSVDNDTGEKDWDGE